MGGINLWVIVRIPQVEEEALGCFSAHSIRGSRIRYAQCSFFQETAFFFFTSILFLTFSSSNKLQSFFPSIHPSILTYLLLSLDHLRVQYSYTPLFTFMPKIQTNAKNLILSLKVAKLLVSPTSLFSIAHSPAAYSFATDQQECWPPDTFTQHNLPSSNSQQDAECSVNSLSTSFGRLQ